MKTRRELSEASAEQRPILSRIRKLLAQSSKRQHRVAAFFLENFEDAVFMSIPQLAEAARVSTSTIARFPQLLGYRNFPSFQKDLRQEVKQQLRPPYRLARNESRGLGKIEKRIRRYCEQHIYDLQKTYEGIKLEDFERGINLIIRSRWVWVVGMRGSHALAHDFNFKLRQILRKSSLISLGSGDYLDSLVMIRPEDLVVGFSFSRFTRSTVDLVRGGKERGAKTLTFSDRLVSPLTPYSDVNFVVHVKGLTFTNAYVGAFSLINCLLGEVSRRTKRLSVRNLQDLDAQLLKGNIFYFG
jgi:DNA-binding MurR/RpiR family transcriptional regulator